MNSISPSNSIRDKRGFDASYDFNDVYSSVTVQRHNAIILEGKKVEINYSGIFYYVIQPAHSAAMINKHWVSKDNAISVSVTTFKCSPRYSPSTAGYGISPTSTFGFCTKRGIIHRVNICGHPMS